MKGEVVQFQRPYQRAAVMVENDGPAFGLFALFYVVVGLAAIGAWNVGAWIISQIH